MKTYCRLLSVTAITVFSVCAQAQSVTFDFDNAPQHAPLPLYLTAGGITGYFSSGTPLYNYSIQAADVLGFTPEGFSGLCIFPSTIYQSDLLVSFNTQLTSASILYAPEEYATDSSCTIRMTAYLGVNYVGTNTYQIPNPGTWPSGTLSFSSTSPFDTSLYTTTRRHRLEATMVQSLWWITWSLRQLVSYPLRLRQLRQLLLRHRE